MTEWHETRTAWVCLRLGGAALLSLAWATGRTLYATIHAHAPRPASLGELGLCMLLFALVIAGGLLLVVGPGLWRRVERPQPRHAALTDLPEVEPTPTRERAAA